MTRMSAVQGATPATAGEVLALIRSGAAVTRSAIAAVTGLSRTAVSARLSALIEAGLVVGGEEAPSGGGRPPSTLRFNGDVGVVLAVAIGRSRTQLAVCDLAGRILAQDARDHSPGLAPDDRMAGILGRLRSLLAEVGRPATDVRAVGISIPGSVDHDAGASLDSPLLPGWDGVPLAPYFAEFGQSSPAPVFLDNDANVLAASETGALLASYADLLLVKVSTGLGVGIVVRGELVRGAWGAAGELGHLKSAAAAGRTCRCGEVGCLEAVAGGWALVQELSARGREVEHVRVLVALAREGDAEARALIRESGRRVGEVLAQAVNLLNPAAVVLGGDMAAAYDTFVAGFREGLYANAASIATRQLQVLQSTHGEAAGIVGCASMAVESLLEPARVDRALARAPLPA
jgi:predicted NBD/HSP70 family sugar kinase